MVVMIQGGLGNQMFGYAFAKALETRLNTAIIFIPQGIHQTRIENLN